MILTTVDATLMTLLLKLYQIQHTTITILLKLYKLQHTLGGYIVPGRITYNGWVEGVGYGESR